MKKNVMFVIGVFVFLACGGISPIVFAQGSQDSDLSAIKQQLKTMEKTIKEQQKMINTLMDKIGTPETVAGKSASEMSGNPKRSNTNEVVAQIVDEYLMKKETREKIVKAGLSHRYVYWDNGIRFKTEDGNFKFKFGGRIMNDWGWFDEDNDIKANADIGDQVDGTEFRRARLYLSGDIYKNIGFKLQLGFASGGRPDFKDAYIALKKIPIVGNLRVGHFKEPFSLEELTSSKYITLIERSLNNAFVPGRNTGFMVHNHALNKRMTWAGGVFRNANSWGDSEGDRSTEGGYSFSGRITGLPWYADKGRKLVHVGLSYSYQNAFNNGIRYRSTPEMHMASRFVDTGTMMADDANLFNPELGIVYGPFSLQTEYTYVDVNLKRSGTVSDPDFSGFYVSGSYFITGENRKYSTKGGSFSRVKPKKNFLWGKGLGAIELTARYSQLDLSDESITGGKLDDITLGVNWYLNPNTRIMFNYVHAEVDFDNNVKDGNADLAGVRFQIDF